MGRITLFIAEKPSMARDIAFVLGAKSRDGIKWVGQDVWISWCIGHLVEIAQPDQHDPKWKTWHPSSLPVMPTTLKWLPKKKTSTHFNQLAQLIKSRDVLRVVNACDAGREGELIFRAVYEVAGGKKPVSRFWVSSLTTEAIRQGLNHLRPSSDFDSLGAAAYCRAEADWLVGMNATRALTSRSSGLLSIGRVQTPTLNMIVTRQNEIDAFVAETYWELEARLESKTGAEWTAKWQRSDTEREEPPSLDQTSPDQEQQSNRRNRISTLEQAEGLMKKIRGVIGQVTEAKGEEKLIPPPQLYHLTALQQECNRRFGLTADQTLKIAQSLYEKHKMISYPRTDSRHLTPDVAKEIPKVISALSPPWSLLVSSLTIASSSLGKRYVNAQKVTDHHAIIPTTKSTASGQLSADEFKVYDLIVRSLLCALSPPAKDQFATLIAVLAQETFIAKGRIELSPGWRAVAPPKRQSKGEPSDQEQLPFVEVGTPTRAKDSRVLEKQTQAPKPYSDATLLGAMEHAGRQIEDEELRAAMKNGGLGTPATRASVIDTLLKRGYISRSKKTLVPTESGFTLVSSVNHKALLEPELTAEWERRLQAISEGTEDPHRFISEIRTWVSELAATLPNGPRINLPDSKSIRGGSHFARGDTPRQSSSPRTTEEASWRGNGNRSKASVKKGSAAQRSTTIRQSARELNDIVGQVCPRCQTGQMIRGRAAWGCGRWREGCHFTIPFELDGVKIPEPEAARLCVRKQSRLFHELEGIKYRLELNVHGEITWGQSQRSKSNAKGSSSSGRGSTKHRKSSGSSRRPKTRASSKSNSSQQGTNDTSWRSFKRS